MLSFSDSDRILFVAPHPDDESLGGGGLLQRAFAARIPIRILFATNGENNPWAQRFWERRWRIGLKEQLRWGKRRQEEALAAIASLGGSPECVRFLNFHDQGITSLLMQGSQELFSVLADEICAFNPSVIILPTMLDAHPDHSALSVAITLILNSIGNSGIRVWEYLVHRPQVGIRRRPVILRLDPAEVERKRSAILCHETQVALSARRFMRFARAEETFYAHAAIGSDATPILKAQLREDVLNLVISARSRERLGSELFVAFRSRSANNHRWRVKVPILSGVAQITDVTNGNRLHDANVTWNGSSLSMGIPIIGIANIDALFVKFSSRTLFFDRSGWCQIRVGSNRSAKERPGMPNLLKLH